MKREPVVYAVLLVAALALAFRTWTHEPTLDADAGKLPLWSGQPEAIDSVEYSEPGHHLVMRQRGSPSARYLWATDDTASVRMDAGTGERLLGAVASPRAERDLGAPNPRTLRAYGLDTSRTRLVVHFHDGTRELLLGGITVDRTGDTYVLERRSGHVFILPSLEFPPLADAANLLVEHRLHSFAPESAATVTVRFNGRSLTMRRLRSETRTGGIVRPAWVPASGAGQPDTAFANLMLRVDATAASSYAAREDPRALTSVLRADYADNRGHALGFLELLQRPGPDNKPLYFVRSELTGVPVNLYPGAAQELLTAAARRL